MRGSYHKERRASSAGVSRSKIAAEARKKKLAESSSTSETLKSVFADHRVPWPHTEYDPENLSLVVFFQQK